jgi:type I restriction enzyme S subunit
MNWEEKELGEMVTFAPKVSLKKGENYAFVGMEDINSIDRFVNPLKIINFDGASGARFYDGNILFARITPCLENRKIAQVKSTNQTKGIGSTEFFVFDSKPDISDIGFLYYLLTTDLIVENAVNSMVGASGRQRADWQYIKKIKINFPPLPIQQRIAEILGRYDELIENYQRQIKILESNAQEIYREMFVRRIDKENLPDGWEEIKIGDVCKIARGSSPRPINDQSFFVDGSIPWIKIADATASGKFLYETKEHVNEYGASFSRHLEKGSLIIATSGTLGFCIFLGVKGCVHDGWLYIAEHKDSINLQYMFFVINSLTDYFNNMSYGAAIQNINTDILRETPMILPDKASLNKFQEVIIPIDEKVDNLSRQISKLRQMRDKLLPRLLNGELVK